MLVEEIEFAADAEVPADGTFYGLVELPLNGAGLTVDIDDSAAGAVDFSEIRCIVIEKHGILHRFLRNEWINWIRKCPRDSPNLVACERHPSIPHSLTESCQPHPEDRI